MHPAVQDSFDCMTASACLSGQKVHVELMEVSR